LCEHSSAVRGFGMELGLLAVGFEVRHYERCFECSRDGQ
jgi:hypothetical protein